MWNVRDPTLLLQENSLQLNLDRYKTSTLGLPPDLPIELDDTLIQQFQLVPREATEIQNSLVELQDRVGDWPDEPDIVEIDQALRDASQIIEPVRRLFEVVQADLAGMEELVPTREKDMIDKDKKRFLEDREQLYRMLKDLERSFSTAEVELRGFQEGLTEQTRNETARQLVSWVRESLQLAERLVLIPARARLETVIVEPIPMEPDAAFRIALANRLDFMNGRAALVDSWRLVQVNADALQSVLNVTASGNLRTARNNPLSFRAPTGTVRMGLEFDAPFTRLLERNAYRESLIRYQQNRRDFIQSRDALHLGLRALLRDLEQLRQNLEIQRLAVTIAIRQVDETQLRLNPPRPAPAPGTRPAINPTTAFNLLSAQSALLESQNSFLNAWLNFYATRMRLYRELGVMAIDPEGRWVEIPLPGSDPNAPAVIDDPGLEELPPPPLLTDPWIDVEKYLHPNGPPNAAVQPAGYSAPVRPAQIRRLPPPGVGSHN